MNAYSTKHPLPDMKDLKFELIDRTPKHGQIAEYICDVKVTHLPTGIVVVIPNKTFLTGNRTIDAARRMINAALQTHAPESTMDIIQKMFAQLTDDERLTVMSGYCLHCGRAGRCQCWNDE